jgi:Winged helix DNA-binding domain
VAGDYPVSRTPDQPLPVIPLARLFVMAARYLTDELHRRLSSRGWPDIPPATGYLLLACRHGPTTGNEIAALMRTWRPAAELIEGLEAAGLVERHTDDSDSRRKLVVLSERGRSASSSSRQTRRPEGCCGAAGTRTPDLLLAKQPLYHLSYSPERNRL